tara:strand:- start:197 stop:1138 length:942 start_codon:yes stop_codon:yes gene_type:complete
VKIKSNLWIFISTSPLSSKTGGTDHPTDMNVPPITLDTSFVIAAGSHNNNPTNIPMTPEYGNQSNAKIPLMSTIVNLAMDDELQDFLPGGDDELHDWDNVMGNNGGVGWDLGFGPPAVLDDSISTNGKGHGSGHNKSKMKKNATKQSSAANSSKPGDVERDVDVRLKRNRESAKQYRLRKKAEVGLLTETLATLEKRNEDLKKQVADAQAQRQMVNVQNIEEFNKRMDELGELVDSNATDEALLHQLYRLRIDYHARSARLNYHLEKIQKLMQPLPIEEVCVSCCYGSTNPSAYTLLQTLVSAIGVDDEKMKR